MDTNSPDDDLGAAPRAEVPPTGPTPPLPPQPSVTDRMFAGLRRLDIQRADDRWIGGVCAGLSNRFGLDPLVWRGILAASVLLGGLGLVLYGLAWMLLPERRDGRIHLEEVIAGRFDIALLGAAAFVVIGLGRGGHTVGWGWGPGPAHALFGLVTGIAWTAFVVAVIVVIVLAVRPLARSNGGPIAPARPYAPGAPTPPSPDQAGATQPYGPQASAAQAYPTQPYATQASPTQTYPTQTHPTQTYPAQTYPAQTYPAAADASGAAQRPAAHQPGPVNAHHPRATWNPSWDKPRVVGPGAATVCVVVGLTLIALAALLAASRNDSFTGPVVLTTVGIGVVLAGLGILVSGLRGRSSGVLGFLAIAGILVAMPLGASADSDWRWDAGTQRFAGDTTLTATTRDQAAEGVSQVFGDVHLDLSDVPMTSTPLVVPVSLGAGNLTVTVGKDTAVEADVHLRAGQLTWDVGDTTQSMDGVSTRSRSFADEASAAGHPQLDLQLSVGAGNVTIVREDS
ncbi:PspC domain-containing protein [Cellulomonas sp. JH27-2]|uniref:PspC domain-containing protein n=1 Tax=Cellulomonas sp. JH27-2 TaxID=2774139 RepID=UPI0017829FCE|nr:PspC domain-containing protein [Cellulomonas sp. JH27-2]MBD8060250.1 PspC domain-containing protein [Cellulomonas sp. JH27-2]